MSVTAPVSVSASAPVTATAPVPAPDPVTVSENAIVETMRVRVGDLLHLALRGEFDVIIHGCNCQCTMGAGIAKAIRATFPEAYAADQKTKKGDREKLGTISFVTVERDGRSITVVNAYTQFDYRGRGVLVDYDAVRSAMQTIKLQFSGKRIGYPKIGAGLAKGDWPTIAQIIGEELAGEDHTVVELP